MFSSCTIPHDFTKLATIPWLLKFGSTTTFTNRFPSYGCVHTYTRRFCTVSSYMCVGLFNAFAIKS